MKYAMKILYEARADEDRWIGQDGLYQAWATTQGRPESAARAAERIRERTARVDDLSDAIEELESNGR